MAQIITPTKLINSNVSYSNTPGADESYRAAQRESRANSDHDYQEELRQKERDTDAAMSLSLEELTKDNGPPPSDPPPPVTDPRDRSGVKAPIPEPPPTFEPHVTTPPPPAPSPMAAAAPEPMAASWGTSPSGAVAVGAAPAPMPAAAPPPSPIAQQLAQAPAPLAAPSALSKISSSPLPPPMTQAEAAPSTPMAPPPIPALQHISSKPIDGRLDSLDLAPTWDGQAPEVNAPRKPKPVTGTAMNTPAPPSGLSAVKSSPSPSGNMFNTSFDGAADIGGDRGAVSSKPRRDLSKTDRSLAKNLAKVNPREAVKYLGAAEAKDASQLDKERAIDIQILNLAEEGKIDQAVMLGRQNGQELDPAMLQNGRARRAMRTALDVAKMRGASHDEAWTGRFTQSYLESDDIETALAAAGKPTPAPQKVGTFKTTTMAGPDGKPRVGSYDTTKGTLTDTGQNALDPKKYGVAAQKDASRIAWIKFISPILGGDKAALEWESKAKANPNTGRTSVINLARSIIEKDSGLRQRAIKAKKTPAQQATAEAQTAYKEILQSEAPESGGVDDHFPESTFKEDAGGGAPLAATPKADGRQEMDVQGRGVYTMDNGKSWYWSDTDTPYDGDYEGE